MKSNARKKTKFRDAASGGRGMRSPPSFFKKIEKKCPDFGKNMSDYIHLKVKFLIENVVLGVSR